jgi:hypothetical protein
VSRGSLRSTAESEAWCWRPSVALTEAEAYTMGVTENLGRLVTCPSALPDCRSGLSRDTVSVHDRARTSALLTYSRTPLRHARHQRLPSRCGRCSGTCSSAFAAAASLAFQACRLRQRAARSVDRGTRAAQRKVETQKGYGSRSGAGMQTLGSWIRSSIWTSGGVKVGTVSGPSSNRIVME